MDWILANQEWLFSGIGVLAVTLVIRIFNRDSNKSSSSIVGPTSNIVINNNAREFHDPHTPALKDKNKKFSSLEEAKNSIRILFVDDDIKFKVVKILVKSGWVHTRLIKDVEAIDNPEVTQSDILFIDVQGVGAEMGFSDEGLGLAMAIKDKYPEKYVVIYSAQIEGDRFHAALRKADASLPKNADPYQFQKLVEDFTVGVK
ncbi:MAG TPA: hypothetical protein VFF75_10530 [Methylophilaceae bacterium]|nr:hypothetical protein [Methylophilaceae bacterium]